MARIKGSGIKFDNARVTELAAAGMTVKALALALGSNKATFMRVKANDSDLKAAYETGISQFASRTGMKVVTKLGVTKAVQIDSGEQLRASRITQADLILKHLTEKPGENVFGMIRKATQLSSGAISEVMTTLILERGVIRAVRNQHGNFQYFIVPQARDSGNNNNNGIRFNGRQPAKAPNRTTQWQAAY